MFGNPVEKMQGHLDQAKKDLRAGRGKAFEERVQAIGALMQKHEREFSREVLVILMQLSMLLLQNNQGNECLVLLKEGIERAINTVRQHLIEA